MFTLVSGTPRSVLEVVLNRLAVLETHQKVQTAILNDIRNAVQRNAVIATTELPEELSLPVDSVDELIDLEGKIQTREIRRELV